MHLSKLEKKFEQTLLQRFLTYVHIDTQSNENSQSTPSSNGQKELAQLLEKELKLFGISTHISPEGYLYAHIPANIPDVPKVGFIAHLDTSPELPGIVNPKIIRNYQGQVIRLSQQHTLEPSRFPELTNYIGHTIICTDGSSLLGADDKAGIAEIITMIEYLMNHPHIPHGEIYIAFTPDEEIGKGTKHFDLHHFNVDFAYTVDGGASGEIETENFNAAKVIVTVKGISFHPGYAKGKMINAIQLLMEFLSMLPAHQQPQFTEGKDGFYHCYRIEGTVEEAKTELLIRDFEKSMFEEKKTFTIKLVHFLQEKYPLSQLNISIEDQYFNMQDVITQHPYVLEIASKAIQNAGLSPVFSAVRGGTDGAHLSNMGIPCPNLFTGGHNFHSVYEYISLQSMTKAVITLLNIVILSAQLHHEK